MSENENENENENKLERGKQEKMYQLLFNTIDKTYIDKCIYYTTQNCKVCIYCKHLKEVYEKK